MSDTDSQEDNKTGAGRLTLQLKRSTDAGGSRPNIASGGRGKSTVIVEHKRKLARKDVGAQPPAQPAPPVQTFDPSVLKPKKPEVKLEVPAAVLDDTASRLTGDEREARFRALEGARRMEEEIRRSEEENARRFAEERTRRETEDLAAQEARRRREEDAKRKTDEEERRKVDEQRRATEAEQRRKSEDEARVAAAQAKQKPDAKPKADAPNAAPARKPTLATKHGFAEEEEDDGRRGGRGGRGGGGGGGGAAHKPVRTVREEPRRRGKITVNVAALDDGEEAPRQRSLAALRRAREKEKRLRAEQGAPAKVFREVIIPDRITVQELANRMTERAVDVVRALMKNGIMAGMGDVIDTDTAELIVSEFGHTPKRVSESDVEIGVVGEADIDVDMESRPPVVTIMGHVDHGKTSLLDALRTTDVVSGEAGGITQHIGAYQVTLDGGQKITFLDTPGHEAFTAMRSRGAKITDIVVLVVAADDGVMPQTIEAINHARAAEVPMIVAINKIDKPAANPDRVRQELLQHSIVVEELGGDVMTVPVSALKRLHLDKLTEAITLQAEVLELKANPNRAAEGVVVEAELDKGRGAVATVLVKRGTLKIGDIVVAGTEWGKVRALVDDRGRRVSTAGPSFPVEVLGLSGAPSAGDDFSVVESEARAREIADFRARQLAFKKSDIGRPTSLETLFGRLKESQAKSFSIVLKGDVQGSVEAITGALEKLGTDEVKAKVLHSAVGGVTESDVILAKASNAPILAFNVRANAQARDLAEREGIEIRYYSVIYDLVDDVKAAMSGLLAPERRETTLGMAQVLQVFTAGKTGKAAGCLVVEGLARSGAKARLLRDDVVIYDGDLGSLRRFKDEVKEVRAGTECGMSFVNYSDLKAGDMIEIYEVVEVSRSL